MIQPRPKMRLLLLFLIPLLLSTTIRADEKIRQLLTSGGGAIDFGKSVPGKIDITSDDAFPLIQDTNGSVVAAAGTPGKGGLSDSPTVDSSSQAPFWSRNR